MKRQLRRPTSDDGVGMILVIGLMGLITALTAVAGTIAVNSVTSSQNRVTYEQALATAESGIDYSLGKLQKAFDEYNADWPTPSPATAVEPSPICDSAVIAQTATDDATERAEARTNLLAIAGNPACRQQTGEGEYVVWKPPTPLVNGLYPKFGKIYAMSFVPSYDPVNPKMKTRVVKAEYLFMPYRPTNAVLTGGALTFDSSTAVTTAYGVDPAMASVHTNSTVSVNGNPTVSGSVTSSGTSTAQSNNFINPLNPGGVVVTKPLQRIPQINARNLYFRTRSDYPEYATYSGTVYQGPWYDLCPDGSARPQAPAPTTPGTGEPCSSTEILNAGNPGVFRGWSYDAASRTWIASNVTQSGIYYVHHGNIDVGPGNGDIDNITVIASAENSTDCTTKNYGNIQWNHFTMKAPAMTNLFMYADTDLVTHSNFTAGSGISTPPVISGMFVAGDQMSLQTSSAGAVGSVIVGDQCNTDDPDPGLILTNEIKNPNIYYDPYADAPFTSIISTTLWLEYVG